MRIIDLLDCSGLRSEHPSPGSNHAILSGASDVYSSSLYISVLFSLSNPSLSPLVGWRTLLCYSPLLLCIAVFFVHQVLCIILGQDVDQEEMSIRLYVY